MKKNPNLINTIMVKYYRSINSQVIKECSPLNIITGSNDAGKSNLLRALNLFFTETNEHGEDIIFQEEFSHSRLDQVRKESVKGKQFIQIEIEFNRMDSFVNTLPKKFKVRKTWFRDSYTPTVTNDLDYYIARNILKTTKNKAEGSLQRFLNSIIYTYVPAIKDRTIFENIVGELQSALFSQSETAGGKFIEDVERFSKELESQAQELRQEFSRITGIDARISLPSNYVDLFRAFEIKTASNYDESVSLDNRGDGIRVRFLPAILNYIAERSSKLHIWGFEEPENSMEYKRAFELADTMLNNYSKNAQIFLTTHSPAFINLERQNQSIYMASQKRTDTQFERLGDNQRANASKMDPYLMIADELGHISLMNELHKKLEESIVRANDLAEASKATLKDIENITRPVLLTEGKTDVSIIEQAWKALRNTECPFAIKSCNVLAHDDPYDAAGAGQLAMCLKSIMADHPSIVMGLFDRDSEGMKCWRDLGANFTSDDLFSDVKVAKNRKAVGILLPISDDGLEYESAENHCIEYMFSKSVLERKIDGNGLKLQPIPVIVKCGPMTISKTDGTELWQMKIVAGKKAFAEKVVPTLIGTDFIQFEKLFTLIEGTIKKSEMQETTRRKPKSKTA